MTAPITLRREKRSDHDAICEVHLRAFGRDNESKLVHDVRGSFMAFVPELSIVATMDDRVVGHIMFTKCVVEYKDSSIWMELTLAPLAVLPEYQKRGIGSMLVRKGLEEAKRLRFRLVAVLTHEHYYSRFGFEPAEKWNIKLSFDFSPNVLMAMQLVPDAPIGKSGTLSVMREFAAVLPPREPKA